MLDYNIIAKKPIIHNSEEYIDLAQPTYVYKDNVKGEIIIVNQYYVSRPDLVSLAVYGDDKYADIICKINGISNPFELNENDILFIPAIDEIISLTKVSSKASELISNTSNNLSNIKKDLRKKLSEKRSPNEMVIGEQNYIIDHSLGLVFY